MTVDDIVKDFKDNFITELEGDLLFCRKKPFESFKNWLKQKLTEYGNEKEREGQAKVYQLIETRLAYDKFFKEKSKEPDCDKVCLEIFKDCQKKLDKLKKLEGE